MVNRRRKEVLTKGAVIGVVIGLGAGAVEPLVAGLLVGVVKDLATGSKRLLSISVAKIKTKRVLLLAIFSIFSRLALPILSVKDWNCCLSNASIINSDSFMN